MILKVRTLYLEPLFYFRRKRFNLRFWARRCPYSFLFFLSDLADYRREAEINLPGAVIPGADQHLQQ